MALLVRHVLTAPRLRCVPPGVKLDVRVDRGQPDLMLLRVIRRRLRIAQQHSRSCSELGEIERRLHAWIPRLNVSGLNPPRAVTDAAYAAR